MFEIRDSNDPGARGPTIEITRGDSASFSIELTDFFDEPYELQEGDVVTFTVKKNTKTTEKVFQKTGLNINILPTDTEKQKYGTYRYDVQFSNESSDTVDTVLGPAEFIISEEVTF